MTELKTPEWFFLLREAVIEQLQKRD